MKRSLFIGTVVFLIQLTSNTCLANPMPLFPYDPVEAATQAVALDTIVDLAVLGFTFACLGLVYHLKTGRFWGYFVWVVIGGLLIDVFGLALFPGALTSFVSIFIALTIFNALLSGGFLKLRFRQALVIGLVMGLLTNPVLWKPVIDEIFPDYEENPHHIRTLDSVTHYY